MNKAIKHVDILVIYDLTIHGNNIVKDNSIDFKVVKEDEVIEFNVLTTGTWGPLIYPSDLDTNLLTEDEKSFIMNVWKEEYEKDMIGKKGSIFTFKIMTYDDWQDNEKKRKLNQPLKPGLHITKNNLQSCKSAILNFLLTSPTYQKEFDSLELIEKLKQLNLEDFQKEGSDPGSIVDGINLSLLTDNNKFKNTALDLELYENICLVVE